MESRFKGTYGTMYNVRDMKKSVSYYKDVVGLQPRFESESWTEFQLGSGALCLHQYSEGMADLQGKGILITEVKDLGNLVSDLKKRGVEFFKDIHEVHPGAHSADFKDPDGNWVSLYEDTNQR